MKISWLIPILFLLSGCVTADQYTKYLENHFIGKNMTWAVEQYGPPTASANYKDGKVHEWTRSMGYRTVASEMGSTNADVERFCTWRVLSDKNGVITQAGWQGNACYNQLQPLPKQ